MKTFIIVLSLVLATSAVAQENFGDISDSGSSNSKGDLKHLNLEKSKFNWKDLMKALKDMDCRGYVICNSPNLEVDAAMLKQYYVALSG